jgi:hypothetical protein
MIFTVYFSSSGSWCFEMCPTGRGVGTLLLDEIQKLQVGNPAETPKKKTGTSNYPWLRQVTLSPCAYIYIHLHTYSLGIPHFADNPSRMSIKKKKMWDGASGFRWFSPVLKPAVLFNFS